MVYEFVPPHVHVVAPLLDRVVNSGDDLIMVWERLWLDEQYKLLDEDLRVEIDFIFAYELQEDFDSSGDVQLVESGLPLTATRPMSATPASAWDLWSQVITVLENQGLRAHIADILLTARVKTSPAHAAFTIAAYMEAADSGEIPVFQAALSLARANNIARSRGMMEELPVRAAMLRQSEALVNDPATSGTALTLLSALSTPPRAGLLGPSEREVLRKLLFAIGDSSISFIDELAQTIARLAENPRELQLAGAGTLVNI